MAGKTGKHRMFYGRRVKSGGAPSGAKHKRKVWSQYPGQKPKEQEKAK